MRDDVDCGAPEVRDPEGPGKVVDRVQRDHVTDHGIGATVPGERGLDRGDRAVLGDPEPRLMVLVAVGRRRHEVFAPGLDPLHRTAQPARDCRNQDVFGIDVALGAETAADVGGDHSHLLLGEAERRGDRRADGERHLRRRPHREPAIRRIGLRHDAARLDRHRGDAWHVEPCFDDRIRLGETAGDVTDGAVGRARDVVWPLVEDPRGVFGERSLDGRGRGQALVSDVHGLGRVGRTVDVVRDHHGHRLADVADLRAGDRGLGVGPEPRRGHERRHRRGALRQFGDREDRNDAGQGLRSISIDPDDAQRCVAAFLTLADEPGK